MSDKLAALEKILANQKTSGNLIMKEYQDRQRQAEAKVASNMTCKYYTTQMVSSETIDLLKQNFCQIPSHRLFVACKVMNKSFFHTRHSEKSVCRVKEVISEGNY